MVKEFKHYELGEEILRSLEKMGYVKPTKVQSEVIDYILNDQDVIVKSRTGSGKTASFAIPLLEKAEWLDNEPHAVILTPTRELAMQVKDELQNIGLHKRLHTVALYGRSPISQQIQELKQKTHIVVATPGRLLDLLERGAINVDQVKYLILDEADEMLKMGFIDQVESIIKWLPTQRVTCMFSATMPERIAQLADTIMIDPIEVHVESEASVKQNISHTFYRSNRGNAEKLLLGQLSQPNVETVLIFANTHEVVEDVYELLKEYDILVERIHGGLLQKERTAHLELFHEGKIRVLVATDVASRGIDIDSVSMVINYEFPHVAETYVHRAGRTGRNEKKGLCVSFVNGRELDLLERVAGEYEIPFEQKEVDELLSVPVELGHLQTKMHRKNLKKAFLKQEVFTIYLAGGKDKKIRAKDILGVIMEIEGIAFEDIGKIHIKDHTSYVDILNQKGPKVLEELGKRTIKGKKIKVEKAKG
ncbi:MAG: DEAD/DEAH box helicase [Erysipelotrichaceae bacterium]